MTTFVLDNYYLFTGFINFVVRGFTAFRIQNFVFISRYVSNLLKIKSFIYSFAHLIFAHPYDHLQTTKAQIYSFGFLQTAKPIYIIYKKSSHGPIFGFSALTFFDNLGNHVSERGSSQGGSFSDFIWMHHVELWWRRQADSTATSLCTDLLNSSKNLIYN